MFYARLSCVGQNTQLNTSAYQTRDNQSIGTTNGNAKQTAAFLRAENRRNIERIGGHMHGRYMRRRRLAVFVSFISAPILSQAKFELISPVTSVLVHFTRVKLSRDTRFLLIHAEIWHCRLRIGARPQYKWVISIAHA